MGIQARVVLNSNIRSAGPLRILFNRFTPTRGTSDVTHTISNLAVHAPMGVLVERTRLIGNAGFGNIEIPGSEVYAHLLHKAGIVSFTISKESKAEEVKAVLNAITDNSLKELARRFPDSIEHQSNIAEQMDALDITHSIGSNPLIEINIMADNGTFLSLASDPSPEVRLLAARSPFATGDALHLLSFDNRSDIQHAVIRNGNTRLETLAAMEKAIEPEERQIMSENQKIATILGYASTTDDIDAIRRFFASGFQVIKSAVLDNPNAPFDIFETGANDPDPFISKKVETHPYVDAKVMHIKESTSPEELANFASSYISRIRKAVALNPNTPWEKVVEILNLIPKDVHKEPLSYKTVVHNDDGVGTYIYETPPDVFIVDKWQDHLGYVGNSHILGKRILEAQAGNSDHILARLKELNPELHLALTNFEAYKTTFLAQILHVEKPKPANNSSL